MRDNAEHEPDPKVVNASVPEWAKFAGSIIGTVVLILGWVEARFVSRVEWSNHQAQQIIDMQALKERQSDYARAEIVTGQNLTELKVDVSEIKSDVAWLRDYLDLSRPPKKKPRQ